MGTHEKETFLQTYDWADGWEQLPWAHDEPTLFLAEICQVRQPGTALDIGCGAGTDSVFLARQGWDVTSLDFVPRALEYTQQRARAAGVEVTPVEADITDWVPPRRYDLVLDHGLLHNMDPVRHAAYRACVLRALADDGEFVLLHWHPLFPGQANGQVGPARRDREEIRAFFAPDLHERFFAREEFEDLPAPVGRGMTQAYYWFRRNPAEAHPAGLTEQIDATLARHGIDPATPPDDVDGELLARIVGPGRLGIFHRVPAAAEVGSILADWAARGGLDAGRVAAGISLLAAERHAGVCTLDANCGECAVKFCKRQRNR